MLQLPASLSPFWLQSSSPLLYSPLFPPLLTFLLSFPFFFPIPFFPSLPLSLFLYLSFYFIFNLKIWGQAMCSRKTSISALLTMPKPFTVWITIHCGKFWKRWEYQTTWPASWETYMQVRKQQLEMDMEQQTASKYEKEYIKAVYCHPAYLTYMQSTSWETLGWKKQKLESRLPGEI